MSYKPINDICWFHSLYEAIDNVILVLLFLTQLNICHQQYVSYIFVINFLFLFCFWIVNV